MEVCHLSLLLSPQEWHHVGCWWRLWPGRHDGRGPPCGGAASQAYGQPVEQSTVLNLYTRRSSSSNLTEVPTPVSSTGLQPKQEMSCHWSLWRIHITIHYSSSVLAACRSCGQEQTSRLFSVSIEKVSLPSRVWYWHLTENVLYRSP